jgi:bis(5'-nucleosidyl)-tetraphosphatase
MPREISSGIIIYKREKDRDGKIETKYLLLYHGRGYWNFPKGKLEQGEQSYQAAFREVAEETGIPSRALRLEKNFKVTDKYIYQREGQKHEGYGWFLHKDAQKLLRHHNSRLMLKRAHEHLKRMVQGKSIQNRPQNTERKNPDVPRSS